MANRQHLSLLKQGVAAWNLWRKENPDIRPDLHDAALGGMHLGTIDFSATNLEEADLSSADLHEASLMGAALRETNLNAANLCRADLGFADLTFADLSKADLSAARLWKADLTATRAVGASLARANLSFATLRETDLSEANLKEAELNYTMLVETNLRQANLTSCSIYGISAWDLHLEGATQAGLVLTLPNEPTISVDTFEVAQFLQLLLYHRNVREVITSITSQLVLIMECLTSQRRQMVEGVRDELRKRSYTPVLVDFEKPLSRDSTEMLALLARMARFIIAGVSASRRIVSELQNIIPRIPTPVQPLYSGLRKGQNGLPDAKKYPWLLDGYRFKDTADMLANFEEKVVKPAEAKAKELETKRG